MLAAARKTKKEFPRLPGCLSADSLYACERFFEGCREKKWRYILRFKAGSIPYIAQEYESLGKIERSRQEESFENGRYCYEYVNGINYNGYLLNVVEYCEETEEEFRKGKTKGKERKGRAGFCS